MAYFLKTSKFHNDGPIGERDYEDNQNEVETRNGYRVSPVQSRIDASAAKSGSVSKQRFALIDKMTADFKISNGRRPLPSEIKAINVAANKAVGL